MTRREQQYCLARCPISQDCLIMNFDGAATLSRAHWCQYCLLRGLDKRVVIELFKYYTDRERKILEKGFDGA